MEKNMENSVHMWVTEPLCCTAEIKCNIVNQLCFVKMKRNKKWGQHDSQGKILKISALNLSICFHNEVGEALQLGKWGDISWLILFEHLECLLLSCMQNKLMVEGGSRETFIGVALIQWELIVTCIRMQQKELKALFDFWIYSKK